MSNMKPLVLAGAIGLMQGVKVQNQRFAGSVLDVVHPLPIISGVTLLFGYAVIGGGWLKLKSNFSVQRFASRSIRVAAPLFAVLFGIACIYAVKTQPSIRSQWASHGIVLSCLAGLFVVVAGTLTALAEKSKPAMPFVFGLFLFLVGIAGIVLIVFPNIVPFSLSLRDTASSSTSQQFVLIGAAFVTPVVLGYSAFAYWIFRAGRLRRDGKNDDSPAQNSVVRCNLRFVRGHFCSSGAADPNVITVDNFDPLLVRIREARPGPTGKHNQRE